MSHHSNTNNSKTSDLDKSPFTGETSRRRVLELAAMLASLVVLEACGAGNDTKSAPDTRVSASSDTIPTTTTILTPKGTLPPPDPATRIDSSTQPSQSMDKRTSPIESLPHVEFLAGKPLGNLRIIAPGTSFETDPLVTAHYPQSVKFETPGISADPILETAVGVTYKNPLTKKELPQPGEKGRAVIFGHRTHKANHPFKMLDQLKPDKGHQILLHRTTEYNDDGTEKSGIDLLFNVVEAGIVKNANDPVEAKKVFSEPEDPDARELILYACSNPDRSPGGTASRIYVRAVLATEPLPSQ